MLSVINSMLIFIAAIVVVTIGCFGLAIGGFWGVTLSLVAVSIAIWAISWLQTRI